MCHVIDDRNFDVWLQDLIQEGILDRSTTDQDERVLSYLGDRGKVYWIGESGDLVDKDLITSAVTDQQIDLTWLEDGWHARLLARCQDSDTTLHGEIEYRSSDGEPWFCALRRIETPKGLIFVGACFDKHRKYALLIAPSLET
jgi:hypothetical protein